MTTNHSNAVEVTGLTKTYGRKTVVNKLDVVLPRGSITGLIGPNGAGKTTVMAMLLGLVRPTAGEGTILGHDLHRPTGYVPEVGALIEWPANFGSLSATDNLRYLAILGGHDQSRIPGLLAQVGLAERAHDKVSTYSLGMKQRLGIAAALVSDPELVILDEPSNGVDPVGMRDLRRLIKEIAAQGRTVLVSSHLLSELQQICDHLVVIDRGGMVYTGSPHDLPRSPDESIRVAPALSEHLDDLARLVAGIVPTATATRDHVIVPTSGHDPRHLSAALNQAAAEQGILLAEVSLHHTDLESRYLELVGA